MSYLARHKQTPNEVERYSIVYTGYLDPTGNSGAGEEPVSAVVTITPTTSTPLTATSVDIDTDRVSFDVAGGEADTEYEVTVVMTTTDGRKREDCVHYSIEEAC